MTSTLASDTVARMGDTELVAALREIEARRRADYAAELAILAEMDSRDLPVALGYSSVTAILREAFKVSVSEARRQVSHAKALMGSRSPSGAVLEPGLPGVAAALAEGAVGPGQVDAIRVVLAEFPDTASVEDRTVAEKILVEAARDAEPRILTRLGREILDRLDPDGPEPQDDEPPDPLRTLDLHQTRDGRVRGKFDLDPETGALVTNLISPRSAPRTGDDGPDLRGKAERQGDALADLLHIAAGSPDGPSEAGEPVTLLVSAQLEDLKSGIGTGLVDGYLNLSVAQIRRMACDCHTAPAVFGARGEILDIGRTTRVIPRHIRRALILRAKGCAFPGCDRKAKWTQGHHIWHWILGGPTALHNLVLLSAPPHTHPPHRMGRPTERRRPRIHTPTTCGPDTKTPTQPSSSIPGLSPDSTPTPLGD